MTTMVLKVDLQCSSCYRKVKKILCKFPQIRDQVFDEKTNTVTITVFCCDPEGIRDKLCCKGANVIKSILIKNPEPESEKPNKPMVDKPPKDPGPGIPSKPIVDNPEKPVVDNSPKHPVPEKPKKPVVDGASKDPKPPGKPIKDTEPDPCPGHDPRPCGRCCMACFHGYAGGPCFCGHTYGPRDHFRRTCCAVCFHGYGYATPETWYDDYECGSAYDFGRDPRGDRNAGRWEYFFIDENPHSCSIM